MKRNIIPFVYGLSLPILWGFCYNDASIRSIFTYLVGFAAPVLAVYLYYLEFGELSLKNKISMVLLPLLYIILIVYLTQDLAVFLFNPNFHAFLVFLVALIFPIYKKRYYLYVWVFSLVFPISLMKDRFFNSFTATEKEKPMPKNKAEQYNEKNIFDYSFENTQHKKITLEKGKKTVVITWIRGCTPCSRAIEDLSPYWANNKDINYLYLFSEDTNKTDFETFKEESLEKLDIAGVAHSVISPKFVEDFQLYTHPTFLFFNEKGELYWCSTGYNRRRDDKKLLLEKMSLKVTNLK